MFKKMSLKIYVPSMVFLRGDQIRLENNFHSAAQVNNLVGPKNIYQICVHTVDLSDSVCDRTDLPVVVGFFFFFCPYRYTSFDKKITFRFISRVRHTKKRYWGSISLRTRHRRRSPNYETGGGGDDVFDIG